MATGEFKLFDAITGASGSRDFYTHNSDRVIIRAVPSSGQTATITIKGTATSFESDAGTEIDSQAGVTDAGFITSVENMPCYKITVEYTALTGGSLSVYGFVGGV